MANKTKLTIHLEDPELLHALKATAEERKTTVQGVVAQVLQEWFRNWKFEEVRKSGRSLMDLPVEERRRLFGVDRVPTDEELAERRERGRQLEKLRQEIGPIDIPVNDLLHMSEEELIEKYGYGTK